MSGTTGKAKKTKSKCVYPSCNKGGGDKHSFPGGGKVARSETDYNSFMTYSRDSHPWEFEGNPYYASTIQLHHLIPMTVLKNGKTGKFSWQTACERLGYNINRKNNCIWLPSVTELACELRVPVHYTGHPKEYYDKVREMVEKTMEKAVDGKYCNNPNSLIKSLDGKSNTIFGKVKNFNWLLTSDGKDYANSSKIGCGNVEYLSEKVKGDECVHRKKGTSHGFKFKKSHSLAVGS